MGQDKRSLFHEYWVYDRILANWYIPWSGRICGPRSVYSHGRLKAELEQQ